MDRSTAPYSAKRAALKKALTDLILAQGVGDFSLRAAAARLGTSDRMLLYYFGSKAELLKEALDCIAERFVEKLMFVPISKRVPVPVLMEKTITILSAPDMKPFMALWAEIVALSVRGDALCQRFADQTSAFWTEWVMERAEFPAKIDPEIGDSALITVVEGLVMRSFISPQRGNSAPIIEALKQCYALT